MEDGRRGGIKKKWEEMCRLPGWGRECDIDPLAMIKLKTWKWVVLVLVVLVVVLVVVVVVFVVVVVVVVELAVGGGGTGLLMREAGDVAAS